MERRIKVKGKTSEKKRRKSVVNGTNSCCKSGDARNKSIREDGNEGAG